MHLDAGASHALPPSSALEASASTYLLLGLRADGRPGLRSSLYGSLYGGKSLEQTSGDWASLTVGGAFRAPLSESLSAGIETRGNAFIVGDPLAYRAIRGELFPDLGVHMESFDLYLRGRLGVGRSIVDSVADEGGGYVPIIGDVVEPTEVTTDLWYVGGGPELRAPLGELTATIGATVFRAPADETYLRGSLELAGDGERLSWSLQLQAWDTPRGAEVSGGLTLQLPLGSGWSARAAGGRSDPSPLLRSPPGVYGSAIVTRTLAGADGPGGSGEASVYTLRRESGRTVVRFSVRRPDAEEVSVTGDFSGWESVPLHRRDGRWTGEMEVMPGTHHYGFVVDGEWFVPEHASGRVTDDYGQVNATLVVPPPEDEDAR